MSLCGYKNGMSLAASLYVAPCRHAVRGRGHGTRLCRLLLIAIAFPSLISIYSAAAPPAVPVRLGQSLVMLNGPWRFHTGDDPGWVNPDFDDSSWESVDLTAQLGAHDNDVGLTRYVPGWGARGHGGYSGYAWYRLRVSATASGEEELALAGPPAGDSAYEVFVNGQPLGSAGSAARMNALPKVVFSNSLKEPLDWQNSRLSKRKLADELSALKNEPGDPLRSVGSINLVKQIMQLGLVDRLRLLVFPVVLGSNGKEPLFAGWEEATLTLVDTTLFDSKVVKLEYRT